MTAGAKDNTRQYTFLRMFVRRIRRLTLREALRALAPRRYDVFLLRGDQITLAAAAPVRAPESLVIRCYDASRLSGIPVVDERLQGRNQGYVATLDGEVAHRALLAFDYPRLRQIGNPAAALVIEVYTEPKFRGRGIQSFVQRHMLADALARGLATEVCAEVVVKNLPSLKGITHGGLSEISRVRGVKVGGIICRPRIAKLKREEALEVSRRAMGAAARVAAES
jgi:GNAT superfamily N-acetyltransferase